MAKFKKKSICRIFGNVRVTVRDLDGKILEQTIIKNTITDEFFDLYADALSGDLVDKDDLKIMRLAIGDNDPSLALASSNEALGHEVFRIDDILTHSDPDTGQYKTLFYLAPGDAIGWIKEVGWYIGTSAEVWDGGNGIDSGTLMARVFYERNKTGAESIQFERLDGITEA